MDSLSSPNTKLLSAIARDLPGWKLAPQKARTVPPSNPNIMQGPSVANLARHLGVPAPKSTWLNTPTQAQSFRVMPEGGGAEKIAELHNGQIQIVQG